MHSGKGKELESKGASKDQLKNCLDVAIAKLGMFEGNADERQRTGNQQVSALISEIRPRGWSILQEIVEFEQARKVLSAK